MYSCLNKSANIHAFDGSLSIPCVVCGARIPPIQLPDLFASRRVDSVDKASLEVQFVVGIEANVRRLIRRFEERECNVRAGVQVELHLLPL